MTSEHLDPAADKPLWRRVAKGLGFPARSEEGDSHASRLGWPRPASVTEGSSSGVTPDDVGGSGGSAEGDAESDDSDNSTELSTTDESSPANDEGDDPALRAALNAPSVEEEVGEDVSRETETPTAPALSDASDVSRETPLSDTPLMRAVVKETRQKQELDSRVLPRPDRTRILTVANQKGGVGKTTTTVNVAAALALAGLSVLVVDLDPQGNASTALGVPHHSDVTSIYDVLVDGTPLSEIVQPCPDVDGLLCAPATIDLAGSEIELVSLVARETRLRRALTAYLEERDERIDYVLIDCPPSLGLLTVNAFVAADEVFIPIQCEYYALEGLSQLLKNIDMIRTHLNPTLHVSTILLTMYDARTRLSAQVADEVRNHFGPQTLHSTVPRSVRVSEAPSHGQTVITYDPMSTGALAYREAAAELADRGSSASGDDPTTRPEHDDVENAVRAQAPPVAVGGPDGEDVR